MSCVSKSQEYVQLSIGFSTICSSVVRSNILEYRTLFRNAFSLGVEQSVHVMITNINMNMSMRTEHIIMYRGMNRSWCIVIVYTLVMRPVFLSARVMRPGPPMWLCGKETLVTKRQKTLTIEC